MFSISPFVYSSRCLDCTVSGLESDALGSHSFRPSRPFLMEPAVDQPIDIQFVRCAC
ncbi:unnamed protein product [Periconia digitata]|uniref:Uncharacterized protein n=1 Tax=Periconia digitata TaxID=1303443 RepID=A0A9W4UX19_9PLEO|nr:unnamed protein product [Periconia digitata]